jgi:hypothetical protein
LKSDLSSYGTQKHISDKNGSTTCLNIFLESFSLRLFNLKKPLYPIVYTYISVKWGVVKIILIISFIILT